METREALRRIELARRDGLPKLDLSSLELESVPPELASLTSVREIFLNNNRLTRLPSELLRLTSLNELYLHDNELASVPAEIGRLSLNTLHLAGNRLRDLPSEVASLADLGALHLNGNQLSEVPAAVTQLTSLRTLYLQDNQLAELPGSLGRLTSLSTLYVQNNSLETLPVELGGLTNLSRLDLSNNGLASLPAELGGLARLSRLDLSSNQLTLVPAELGRLTQLSYLDLARNLLRWVPAEVAEIRGFTSVGVDATVGASSSSLVLVGNLLPEELLHAARGGIEQLRVFLRSEAPQADGVDGGEVREETLSELTDRIVFIETVSVDQADALRGALEQLLAWASIVIADGAFAKDPVTEDRVTSDRNFLRQELWRSPSLDAVVVLPLAQRLTASLVQAVPEDAPGRAVVEAIAGKADADPRNPASAIEKAEILATALEESAAELPSDSPSWQAWVAKALGWAKTTSKEAQRDVAAAGGGLLAGSGVAELLGFSGPVGIILGTTVAFLAAVFRRLD